MAELHRQDDDLVLVLTTFEKAEALHGEFRVPLASVSGVEVVDDVIHAVHGMKLPGARWPGKFAVGSFYAGPTRPRTFAVIHHDSVRGLRVRFEGTAYDELLLGCGDPEATKAWLDTLPTGGDR